MEIEPEDFNERDKRKQQQKANRIGIDLSPLFEDMHMLLKSGLDDAEKLDVVYKLIKSTERCLCRHGCFSFKDNDTYFG